MRILNFAIKSLLILAVLATPPIWFVTSNNGLNTALTVASWFAPYKVSYGKADGRIIGNKIFITDLSIEYNAHTLKISTLEIAPRLKSFKLSKITGWEHFLPAQTILALGKRTEITQLDGKFNSWTELKNIDLTLFGIWQAEQLKASLTAIKHAHSWHVKHANLQIGKNILALASAEQSGYQWELNLTQPQLLLKSSTGAIYANGKVNYTSEFSLPEITAQVTADEFKYADYTVKKLNLASHVNPDLTAPLNISANAEKIIINDHIINNFKLNTSGNLRQHAINGSLLYEHNLLNIKANGQMTEKHLWQTSNLIISYRNEALKGAAKYALHNSSGNLALSGKLFAVATDIKIALTGVNNMQADISMTGNAHNHLQASLNMKAGKLDGRANLQVADLSMIMQWLPDVTRLKGLLSSEIKLSGTLDKPEITSNSHLTKITATLPALGVKIKPMELHVVSDAKGKFVLTGIGKMRRGPGEFTLKGYVEPFKQNTPNSLNITGKHVEFIKNTNANLIASNNLNFVYHANTQLLDITGDIDIEQGNVHLDTKQSSTIKSKDVVFINETAKPKNLVTPNININLRISEGVHFSGFGLDADVTGKLEITQRQDMFYSIGRVTIKQGTYQLPGQKLQISKGRLLYPPGTLLANPALDIKMLGKSQTNSNLDLFVRGTAQHPQISESGIAGNTDKALSQALLAGSSMLSKNLLQDKLKLTELGLASHGEQHADFFDNPAKDKSSIKNKDLVIGRPLGKKFYLQYLHSMGEMNKRVRLKYALNKNWAVGIESGDQGGGADLSFSIEKD